MPRLIALILMLFALPACAAEEGFTARVVGVSDGDTITVLTAEKTQRKIRLFGVDAPEMGQDFGARAKQAASDLCSGKDVKILPRDTDRYGRTVAEVILPDGKNLEWELVDRGMAWWYEYYAPGDKELFRREFIAKKTKAGLWRQPDPIPPWDWRRGTRGEEVAVTTAFVGNRSSHLYHSPDCPGVAGMSEKNKVPLASQAEAEAAGYRHAGDCR